jgi:hypothetical protein
MFGRRLGDIRKEKDNMVDRFEKLLAIKDRTSDDKTDGTRTDVRFYCTTDRIGKRKSTTRKDDNGKFKDEFFNKQRLDASGLGLAYNPGDIESRWAHCYDKIEPTLMITMRLGAGYSEIQICPWIFLGTLSKVILPVVAKLVYAPIDVFILMDKVIVHELTHTSQAYPATKDMRPDPYGKITSFLHVADRRQALVRLLKYNQASKTAKSLSRSGRRTRTYRKTLNETPTPAPSGRPEPGSLLNQAARRLTVTGISKILRAHRK